VVIFNPEFPGGREAYIDGIKNRLDELRSQNFDLVGASAGFDNYKYDWGGLLLTEDFKTIGSLLSELAENCCGGKRFAILEGGYNFEDLGLNIKAFLEGFQYKM
jgi:acetoin utilization deacetylase AcuC-like enzyme